jgi:sec-independent protein translocase protein TatA
MPDLGLPELIIILVIIILLFGAGRITKIAGELGKGIRDFRQGIQGDEPVIKSEKSEKVEEPKG